MTTTALLACPKCGTPLETSPSTGRPRIYCSTKCRVAASHIRRKADGRYDIDKRLMQANRQPTSHDLVCACCDAVFTAKRKDAKYCSTTCAKRGNKRHCSIAGCDRAHVARNLCTMHWKQAYGKRAKAVVPCVVCGEQAEKDASTKRRSVCSHICRAYLQHDIWPRCDIPKRHAARGYIKPEHRLVFIPALRDCLWCGTAFTAHRSSALYCTGVCSTKAKRVRRRGREHNAGGIYTWSEVIALFLKFDRCCAYCRQEIEGQPEPDHVIALSRGGSNSITNILPSCSLCNSDKRDLSLSEWAKDRERRHLPPRITEWKRGDSLYVHLAIVQDRERLT